MTGVRITIEAGLQDFSPRSGQYAAHEPGAQIPAHCLPKAVLCAGALVTEVSTWLLLLTIGYIRRRDKFKYCPSKPLEKDTCFDKR